jgi:hypothetical protein
VDYQRQAQAYAEALIKAQKREKLLKILARRKSWQPVRKVLLIVGVIALGIAAWRWLVTHEFWDNPILWVGIPALVVWTFSPDKKAVEKLEADIESDIKNGFL